jgi:hypothetical protein
MDVERILYKNLTKIKASKSTEVQTLTINVTGQTQEYRVTDPEPEIQATAVV